MRLYNSSSCTPTGGPTTTAVRKAKWTAPNVFVPARTNAAPHSASRKNLRTTTYRGSGFRDSMSHPFDVRNDHANKMAFFGDDDIGSRTSNSTLSTQSFVRTPIKRNHSFAMPYQSPQSSGRGGRTWNSPGKTNPRPARQSWSPRKDPVPFMVVPKNSLQDKPSSTSLPSIKLQPRPTGKVCADKKENCDPMDEQISASLASMSLVMEPHGDDVFASPKEARSLSFDESASAWLDFSSDGSDNPFQDQSESIGTNDSKNRSPKAPRSPFAPIEKAKTTNGRRVTSVKPSPVQRTMSAHVLFPTQHSRQAPTSFMTIKGELSAFAAPKRKSAMKATSTTAPSSRNSPPKATSTTAPRRSSTGPVLAPSPRDVDPILFPHGASSTSSDKSIKSEASSLKSLLVDLPTYTNMLKSGIPFGSVVGAMQRDGVDIALIRLVVAAHASH